MFDGSPVLADAEIEAVRAGLAELASDEPIDGADPADWPSAFGAVAGDHARFEDWLVATVVLIQRLARSPVGPGAVVARESVGATLAFPCLHEPLLRVAIVFGARWIDGWRREEAHALIALDAEFDAWLGRAQGGGLTPNAVRFAAAGRELGLSVSVQRSLLRFGWGAATQWMDSSFTGRTSGLAIRLARSKRATLELLAEADIPVPPGVVVRDFDAARQAAGKLGWPVVVKPEFLDQGLGVVTGIRSEDALQRAWERAQRLSRGRVIVERHVDGADHRMLVVGGALLRAARRTPGGIVGDGRATVAEALAAVNADPRRGTSKRSLLIRMTLDEEAIGCLAEQGLAPEDVPTAGRFVHLRRTANISTGGTAEDVTAIVHPDNRLLVERAARIVGLDIVGVDLLCPDVSCSWREVGGAICELNAQPGFRPHWLDERGNDVNREVVAWMYRDQCTRIPVVAVIAEPGERATVFAQRLHRAWRARGVDASLAGRKGTLIGNHVFRGRSAAGFAGV